MIFILLLFRSPYDAKSLIHETDNIIPTADSNTPAISYEYDANGNVLKVTVVSGIITRTFDALNRVTSCTDTAGKTIGYTYNAVGDLTRITYPDSTAVNYTYDANHNLITVTDWANRVTTYTYDVNNNVVGVTKPDGSVTTTVYDNKHRVTSHVERTASGAVITGFEYTYDVLGRISVEKNLAKNVKMCYTYDELSRVIKTNTVDLTTNEQSIEDFSYDAAGNITEGEAVYDANNRLTEYSCNYVSYDADGNMLNDPVTCDQYSYDFAKRLVSTSENTYTYNAEDTRIRAVHNGVTTTYTYDTNCKLSKLLCKTTSGTITKYVYGLGLIGEAVGSSFKTYHFDYRGSTVAITNVNGTVIDTFSYDTYGKLTNRTGNSDIIFLYNGRDGVITEPNGLLYMRARYYSPTLYRFINADIISGEISDSTSLNRYAYVNGNPVMYVDPFGLSRDFERLASTVIEEKNSKWEKFKDYLQNFKNHDGTYSLMDDWRNKKPYRAIKKRGSIFNGQFLVFDPGSPDEYESEFTFDLKTLIPSASINKEYKFSIWRGGWEGENFNLDVFDACTLSVEVSELIDGFFLPSVDVDFEIWSPSWTFKFFNSDITLSLDIGSDDVKIKATNDSLDLSLSWLGINIEKRN